MIEVAVAVLVLGALAAAGLAMVRIIGGPAHADRIVALDILLAAAIALCVAAALATRRTAFIDVGIGLALVGFVATIGWAQLLEHAPRSTRRPEAPE